MILFLRALRDLIRGPRPPAGKRWEGYATLADLPTPPTPPPPPPGSMHISAGTTIREAVGPGMRTWPVEPPFHVNESGWYVVEIGEKTATIHPSPQRWAQRPKTDEPVAWYPDGSAGSIFKDPAPGILTYPCPCGTDIIVETEFDHPHLIVQTVSHRAQNARCRNFMAGVRDTERMRVEEFLAKLVAE